MEMTRTHKKVSYPSRRPQGRDHGRSGFGEAEEAFKIIPALELAELLDQHLLADRGNGALHIQATHQRVDAQMRQDPQLPAILVGADRKGDLPVPHAALPRVRDDKSSRAPWVPDLATQEHEVSHTL